MRQSVSPPRFVVFDVDGTLVDSQHMICAAMAEAFAAEGLAAPERAAVLAIVGLSLPEAMRDLAAGLDAARLPRLCDSYKSAFAALRRTAPHEVLYPGAREALEGLREAGALLAIATGKSQRGVRHLLEREGLTDHFAVIQTADDAPSKPHPAMLQQAMAESGADPDATAMVGDTSFDMVMARRAGVAGVGVAWGYHGREALLAAGADHVAEDFPDLREALERLRPTKEAAE